MTGAGFSLGAKNILGDPVPTVGDLKEKLWELSWAAKGWRGRGAGSKSLMRSEFTWMA